MKNSIIALITALCITLIGCSPAYAGTYNIAGSDTMQEEFKPDLDFILEEINSESLNEKLGFTIAEENIDYSKIVKIYIDTDILENTEFNEEKILETINDADYFYELPIYHGDNKTVLFDIDRGIPLTDEERESGQYDEKAIAYYDRTAGKLHPYATGFCEYKWDYIGDVEEILEKGNIDNAKIYFVGLDFGLTAVIFSENEEAQFLIIRGYDEENNNKFVYEPSRELYSYDEIKEIALNNTTESDMVIGFGSSSQMQIFNHKTLIICAAGAVLAVAAAAAAVTFAIKKKHRKADKPNQ